MHPNERREPWQDEPSPYEPRTAAAWRGRGWGRERGGWREAREPRGRRDAFDRRSIATSGSSRGVGFGERRGNGYGEHEGGGGLGSREHAWRGYAQGAGMARRGAYGGGHGWSGPENRSARESFRGRAPKGYQRADERIREDVCDRLADDPELDPSEVEVRVEGGEVILEGSVDERSMKHAIEDLCDSVPGVKDVRNGLRVQRSKKGARDSRPQAERVKESGSRAAT